MNRNRVVFIGAEETGRRCLEALVRSGVDVAGAFTLDRPVGGHLVGPDAFARFQDLGVPVHFVSDINAADVVGQVRALEPDLLYEIGWSQLLSPAVLAVPRDGCLGMHCSLLPKHRGRAPIPWSIIFGLRRSGMTLFYLSERADAGDIIGQESFAIGPDDTATEVYQKSVDAAVRLITTYHPLLERGEAPRLPSDPRFSDYWPKRTPEDGVIDWDRSARCLYDWVRALTHPFPGAFTFWRDRKLLVWKAAPAETTGEEAGRLLAIDAGAGLLVGTGEGSLWLHTVQLENDEELPACAFAARYGAVVGDQFP